MARSPVKSFASNAELESLAVRQKGVQRAPTATGGGAAAAVGCVKGSVPQNRVPRSETGRHAAMRQTVATAKVNAAAEGVDTPLP